MAKYSDNCADDVDTVLSKLQSDASTGLSSKEVEARQAIYGKNELPEEEGKKAFLTSRCALSLCESRHVWKNVTVVEKDDARRSFTASFNFVLPFSFFSSSFLLFSPLINLPALYITIAIALHPKKPQP